ncbi:MAG: sigma-70 family RNA polymerase sigma factor [Planctomycetota bacterium]
MNDSIDISKNSNESFRSAEDFDSIVNKYQDRLFNTVLRLVGNYEDALDITQEVFLKAYKAIQNFRGSASIYTWLYKIAVNTAFTYKKDRSKRGREKVFSLEQSQDGNDDNGKRELEDSAPETSEIISKREIQQKVQEAILSLDNKLRSIVVLRDIEQLDYDDIAVILDIPKGTVKSRLHRARLILRDKLLELADVKEKNL